MDKDETWKTDEYGKSHEGRVSVLDADGAVPDAVYFDSNSGGFGWQVRHWSDYDGIDYPERPKAQVLRAECACGWTGDPHTVDWAKAGGRPFREHGMELADRCMDDWDHDTIVVAETTIPLTFDLQTLLHRVTDAIEKLALDSPSAAIKAARSLELIAQRTAHGPAHEARSDDPAAVAAALGLNIDDTHSPLARLGGWSHYG